jgi:hypothetical protein
VLARSYGLSSWPRLVTACRMTDAIWRGDLDSVRQPVLKDPQLLDEANRGLPDSNWGPPLSYAANVGQDRIIQMLWELGASDVQHAFDRACLQGTDRNGKGLLAMGAQVTPSCVMGPCETLNHADLELLLRRTCRRRATGWRRLLCFFKPIAATRKASIDVSNWPQVEASKCPTRRGWQCTADASIYGRSICGVIGDSSAAHSRTRKFIRQSWNAAKIIRSACTAPSSRHDSTAHFD